MRFYAISFALLFIIQCVYSSRIIVDGIKNFLGITSAPPATKKPISIDEIAKVLIALRPAEAERKKKESSDVKANVANMNTVKSNISMPDIQMPPITVVVVKGKKGLEKFKKNANH